MDEYGRETFDWPPLHTLRQKPLQTKTVDNNTGRSFLGANGHMPLQVFITSPGGGSAIGVKNPRKKCKAQKSKSGARKSKITARQGGAKRISECF